MNFVFVFFFSSCLFVCFFFSFSKRPHTISLYLAHQYKYCPQSAVPSFNFIKQLLCSLVFSSPFFLSIFLLVAFEKLCSVNTNNIKQNKNSHTVTLNVESFLTLHYLLSRHIFDFTVYNKFENRKFQRRLKLVDAWIFGCFAGTTFQWFPTFCHESNDKRATICLCFDLHPLLADQVHIVRALLRGWMLSSSLFWGRHNK